MRGVQANDGGKGNFRSLLSLRGTLHSPFIFNSFIYCSFLPIEDLRTALLVFFIDLLWYIVTVHVAYPNFFLLAFLIKSTNF